jgi:FecR protein
VQVIQDGQVIADPALDNQPLFEGSQIVTGSDGRAEVEMENGSLARLSPNTTMTLTVLQGEGTGTRTEIVLNSGLAYFELQPSNAENSLKVNYGRASFSASGFSVVRLGEDKPPGELAVFSGNVHLEVGEAVQLDVHGGESLSLNADDPSQYNIAESIAPDSWDSWNADRDQLLTSESAEKTGATSGMANYPATGMSDLDAEGSWYDVPGQGYVWSPYDAQVQGAAWDPYGVGHWVWYPRFGYVWVSGYSWGYAPFQCGLWNYYDGFGWAWAPGGGCNPWGGFGGGSWYGGGGGGWFNIGNGPHHYRPPPRPVSPPNHPHPVPRDPGLRAPGLREPGLHGGRVAVVAVDRRPAETIGLPHAGKSEEPVVIAGHTVEPLRPIAPRQTYNRSTAGFANRTGTAQPGEIQPGIPLPGYYTPGAHPAYPGNAGGGASAHPSAPVSHPAPTHVGSAGGSGHPSAPSGGGGGHAAAPAPAPAPHK